VFIDGMAFLHLSSIIMEIQQHKVDLPKTFGKKKWLNTTPCLGKIL
jgi:hypothetical protein